jgi:uncharacterized protein YjbI with pentapeptide repeats
MPVWVIAVFAIAILVLSVVPGLYFWWPTRGEPSCRSDLGVALMTGALIAFAVLGIQVLVDFRVQALDREREKKAEHRNLELQLALSDNLNGIRLDGESLEKIHLYAKPLIAASLVKTKLMGANLTKANLTEADLREADLSGAYIDQATLSRAKLPKAILPKAFLRRAKMSGAQLNGANLNGADLVAADLSFVVLAGATLVGADLTATNLSNSDLTGADLSRAEIDPSTSFVDAWYDSRTKFPRAIRARAPACPPKRIQGCQVRSTAIAAQG